MQTQILIYSPSLSSRLDYCAGFVFRDVLGMSPLLTESIDEFISYNGPKINYSGTMLDTSLNIIPSGLLFEKNIRKQDFSTGSWHDIPVFFITDPEAEINFDLFSAVFYMISRYEEYHPFVPDKYGRFLGAESFAFRNGFLEIPVVDKWIHLLGEILKKRYPDFNITPEKFKWISTVDVDSAWAYLNRGKLITSASLLKSFIFGNDFKLRMNVLKNKEKDPFFTFDFLRDLHADDPEKLIFFFLSGNPGGINGIISPENKDWQELILNISGTFRIGIHPSSLAYMDKNILQNEIRNLTSITGMPIYLSRQHYLLLRFPQTYRQIIEAGIKDDYSMGFADHAGFRAGTSHPFYFYDLENEQRTDLKIWPFTLMDRTLKDYMKLKPEEALNKITSLIDAVGDSGGTFISLWHNDALGDYGEWKGWKKIYHEMTEYLKSRK